MGQKFSIADYQLACQKGNLQLLKDIVKEGKIDLNSRLTTDDGGCSGLHVAVRNYHPEIISYLLSLSRTASESTKSLVNVEIPDEQARTPFLLAVSLRNIDAVKLFTEFRDVDLAAREVMLDSEIPLNGSFGISDGTELSAFHLAVINDDEAMLECLISAVPKRKKRATSFVSRNPEHQHQPQEGEERGAQSNSPSKSVPANASKDDIVLGDSRTMSNTLSLTITIPSSSSNQDQNKEGESEKHYDVPPRNSPQHLLTGKQLLISLFDSNGLTAVHMAVKYENIGLLKYFVDKWDVNPDLEDLFHQTLLMQACKRNFRNHNSSSTAILNYLILEKGVKVNRASPGGWTAIFYAASNGNLVAVEFLAKNGADLFVKAEKTNHTCADIAHKNGHAAVAETLKELMTATQN